MSLGCGSCNVCCKLLNVPDIGKPSGMACWWTGVHGGCARHSEKPKPENVVLESGRFVLKDGDRGDMALAACAQFRCLWLDSQRSPDADVRLPRHMRPDFTHVMMGPQDQEDETLLYVHVDPNWQDAWRQEPIASYLNDILSRGGRIHLMIGEARLDLVEPF